MGHGKTKSLPRTEVRVAGVLAEFENEDQLLKAATSMRDAGYSLWDCHTPYPVHGMDDAMGIRPTILPWLVLGAGLSGALLATLMQWWMNAVDYPFLISGKPFWSLPANVPIIFECMVLLAGITAFGATLALNGLPCFYRPIFRSERFRRVTDDRFFVWVDRRDSRFDQAEKRLRDLGAAHVETVKEDFDVR